MINDFVALHFPSYLLAGQPVLVVLPVLPVLVIRHCQL
jgi:hypothetical protein